MWIVSLDYEGSASNHTMAVNKASLVEYVQVDMDSTDEERLLQCNDDTVWVSVAKAQLLLGLKELLPPGEKLKNTHSYEIQRSLKLYMTAYKAVEELHTEKEERGKEGGGTTLDHKATQRNVCCFALIASAIAVFSLCVAVFFAWLGGYVDRNQLDPLVHKLSAETFFGWPSKTIHTCSTPQNGTSSLISTDEPLAAFLVWKNLYCGLVLGLVFGFLDNFGLFYGMDVLDPIFYKLASSVVSGMRQLWKVRLDNKEQEVIKVHEAADVLMAGLGNTFSDVLGVALGTSALVIAKSGLGVSPEFWPLDIVAMLIGCLLGAFLPAMMKDCNIYGGPDNARKVKYSAAGLIFMLLATVLLAGIPTSNFKNDPAFLISFSLFILEIITIVVLICVVPQYGYIVQDQVEFVNKLPKPKQDTKQLDAMFASSMRTFNPAKLRIA